MPDKQIHYHFDKKPSKSKFDRQASALKKTSFILLVIIFSGLILAYSLADINEPYITQTVGVNDNMLNLPRSELNGLTLNEVFEEGYKEYSILYNINENIYIRLTYAIYNNNNEIISTNHINFYNIGFQSQLYDNSIIDFYRVWLRVQYQENYPNGSWNLEESIYYYNETLTYSSLEVEANKISIVYVDMEVLGIDTLTKEQMDNYFELYQTLSASNQQVIVYKDNWSLSDKETVGIGGLTAVTGFLASVEKISATIEMAKNMFINIIENNVISTITNTLKDISKGINDFYAWASEKLGFVLKPPPITVPIKPIWPFK